MSGGNDSLDAATSPQAQAEPAPLASVPAGAVSGASTNTPPDAGPPPVPMRADRELPADTPREMLRDPAKDRDAGPGRAEGAKEPKDLAGYTLTAVLRMSDVAGAPKAPEERSAWIARVAEAKELVAFSVTDAYAEARANVGV